MTVVCKGSGKTNINIKIKKKKTDYSLVSFLSHPLQLFYSFLPLISTKASHACTSHPQRMKRVLSTVSPCSSLFLQSNLQASQYLHAQHSKIKFDSATTLSILVMAKVKYNQYFQCSSANVNAV